MQINAKRPLTFVLRAATISVLALTLQVAADDLNFGGLPVKNVTIKKIEGDKIIYTTQAGTPGEKVINERLRVTVTDEPNLVPAEDAFAAGKWADAVDAYQKLLRSAAKPWLKDYSALRLLKAGEKSDRFDAVVGAYIHLLAKDPQAAQDIKLKYPEDPASAYLKTAASEVDAALATEKDPTRQTSLNVFRMNIARAMHDDATVLKKAGELSNSTASSSSGVIDPTVLSGITDGKLNLITSAVDKKDFATAQKSLEQLKPAVTEPKHQAEWLWLSAETNAGIAGETKDAAVLKNLAIDYMRVVANFPTSPRAAQALIKTGAIMEKLNDSKAAIAVYQQVARDFETQPAANEAKKSLARLGSK
jgi:tetratricopeptide (TPR) repeat protein